MKLEIFLVLFLLLNCINLKFEDNDEIIKYYLNTKMNRLDYPIKLNQTTVFIHSNETYIYFLELPEGIIAYNYNNIGFKGLAFSSFLNRTLTIKPQKDHGDIINIKITSILNNVDVFFFKNTFLKLSYFTNKNIVIIAYVEENEDQIISLDSFEKTLLFYYYKYDYNKISPKEFNPINKKFFNKYDGNILHLEKNSIYIFYADLYRLYFTINLLDSFISLEQVNKNILIDEERDVLYLKESEEYYNITFKKSNLNRIFKLSRKTNDSEVINSNKEVILNSNKTYYELTQEDISNGIQIKVTNNNCLIEILYSSKDNTEIFDSYSVENYKLTKKYNIIKIPKNNCKYIFHLSINNKKELNTFYAGFKNKISKANYFYSWSNSSTQLGGKSTNLEYTPPYLYRINIDKEEYQIFEIILDELQLENDIYLTYNPVSYFKYLYKEINEEKNAYILGNISSYLKKFYIYKDIAKKPPIIKNISNYHHKPIDLIDNINKISTKKQTYLSLYQNINKVIRTVRDNHLNIILTNIEDKVNLASTSFCIPFEFYIETKKKEEGDIPVVKMKAFFDCLNHYSNGNYILKYLQDHADIPIVSINNTDPIEYIQNFNKEQQYKNIHAQFSANLKNIKKNRIDLCPFDLSDLLEINYEYENGDIINFDYYFVTPSNFKDINQKEFEDFHLSLNNKQNNINLLPDIFDSKKIFQKNKRIISEEENNAIVWDIETKDKKLKCRVDKENGYNVFLQTSFSFSNINDVIDVMVNCSELFYSNNNKIIGIENQNGGGSALLYEVWHQLIQQKTLDRTYRSLLKNEEIYKLFQENYFFSEFANSETCKFYSSMNEMGGITDNYGFSDEFKKNITHNRSNIYDFLDKTWRKRLESIRKKNFLNNNLKNPTDILIYTDSYCFSACSGFVKAFQNTGGAIIVGFNGHPKIKGTSIFDSSQSSSSVTPLPSEERYELESLGYHVYGVTYSESFDDSFRDPNPTPREYTVDIVDRRVDIYGQYSDDLYSSFISKAKDIFEEFETRCNNNNQRLILNDDNCSFDGHKKGGHPCKEDGTWDMSNCKAYYCDLGYYYDSMKDECILDKCINNENEKDIYIDVSKYNETNEIIVEPNNELTFHLQNDNYFYFFESNISNLFTTYYDNQNRRNVINYCMIDFEKENIFDYEVKVNYYRTIKQKETIKLTIIEKNLNISITNNIYGEKLQIFSYITRLNQFQSINSFQSNNEHIICAFSFNKDIEIYFSEYNFDIKPKEIINIEPSIFKEIPKEVQYINKNKTAIFIFKFPKDKVSSIYLFLTPKNMEQNLEIGNERFLYLSQQKFDYNLYLNSNTKSYCIRLDYQTSKAVIEILDKNKTILNKNNRYYCLDKSIKKISLKLKNDNPALIEFLYEFNNFKNLDTKLKEFNLFDGYSLLRYKKSEKIKSINVNLKNNTNLTFFIFANIVKGNYLGVLPEEKIYDANSINSEFIVPNEKLNDDETFDILFKVKNNATLTVEVIKENDKDNEDDSKGDGFPTWALIVSIIVPIIIAILVIIIIIRKNKKKDIDINFEGKQMLLNYNEN